MIRLMLLFSVYSWLLGAHAHVRAAEQHQADSQAIREIQKLDQSQLDFDFFEDNALNNTNSQQTSEADLLEALELLEQSPDDEETLENNILEPLETAGGSLSDDSELSTEMDEEIESGLDQDISDELQDALEGFFDE